MTLDSLQRDRIERAYETTKAFLLAERRGGHWIGELSGSALSTATAVSALAIARRAGSGDLELSRIIERGLKRLIASQNADGGFGDTDRSYSNIATTFLAKAAIHAADAGSQYADCLTRIEAYLAREGGIAGLRKRYGIDKTFVVPILANCALAGVVPWSEVSPLPFELACVPQSWYRFVGMPVVSYAIPALVAIGQAVHRNRPSWNPLVRLLRTACEEPSLRVLDSMQPQSGGFLEATPLTAFVTMSLAATGRLEHSVTRLGIRFLKDSQRSDGSWPIDTNLATWVTTLSLNALASRGEEVAEYLDLDWLLSCQHRKRHPFTGAEPGGWGWSDLSGAVPDADDTPSALLVLAHLVQNYEKLNDEQRGRINQAIDLGVEWLLKLQNRDGGWPTFCRGWGKLPFDRSGVDLTAHAIRALTACDEGSQSWLGRAHAAIEKGWRYIERMQRADGSWLPLWFGNQDEPDDENPIYGTAKTLLAYRDCCRMERPEAIRGLEYLVRSQRSDGGWGGGKAVNYGAGEGSSSIEETSLAVEALLASERGGYCSSAKKGLAWLCEAVENRSLGHCTPIGFYFAKLWYYEKLYPAAFALSALGRALRSDQTQDRA